MIEPTLKQIEETIDKGLKAVSDYFARNPKPTDGSVKASLEIAKRIRETSEHKK